MDGGAHLEFATCGGGEIGALRLDASGSPVAAAIAERGDLEVAVTVLLYVGGATGHSLDLAGAKAGAGIIDPVGGVDACARGTAEIIAPDGRPGGVGVCVVRRACGEHTENCYDHGDKQERGYSEKSFVFLSLLSPLRSIHWMFLRMHMH